MMVARTSDQLRQQLMADLLMGGGGPSTIGQGLASIGRSIGGVLAGRGAIRDAENREAAMARLLLGQPTQMGPALPGAGPGAIRGLQAGTPGLASASGMGDQEAQALLALDPSGAALMQVMESRRPKPITPYEQAQLNLSERGIGMQEQRLEQDASQFSESMGLQRQKLAADQAYQNARLRLDAANLNAEGNVKLSDIAGIRKEYTGASEDFVKMRDAYSKITAAGADVSPAGDLSLIYNFMRMLDPASTVREGEFAQVAASGGLGERFTGYGNMLLTGQRLTDAQRSDVLAQTANVMREQLGHQLRTETEFGDLAEQYGVPRKHVTPDLIGPLRKGVATVERVAPEPPSSLLQRGAEAAQGVLGDVGDMLGMGGTGEAPAAPQGPQAGDEGLTATNPQTGERVIWRNGRWEPL